MPPREDLVQALIRSCWLVESARATVLGDWDGDFVEDAGRAGRRASRLGDLLETRGIPRPEDVLPAHTDWIRSLCGASPTEVPLGAAVLQRLADWVDVYVTPYLDADADDFRKLGEAELRFPVPPRHISRDEVFPSFPVPPDAPRFAILTDIHVGNPGTEDLARRAVQEINALQPEYVVVPGDITDDGEPEQFALAAEILGGLTAPVHCVLGNHDAVRRSTREPAGAELFAEAFGRKAEDVVLDFEGLQVALVDSTDPYPSPFPDWDLARGGFREDAGGVNNGAYRPGQPDSLAGRIAQDRPLLLVQHHELQPFSGFPPVMFGVRDEDSDELFGALSGHDLLGVVAGHTHRSALTQVGPGVPQLEIPALKDWPYCYTVVSVRDGRPRVTVHQIGDEDLVWGRGQHVPPIYSGYVLGPLSTLDHTF